MRSRRLWIGLSFAAIYLIWGSTYLAISVAVQDVPPLLIGALRFTLAGSLVLAWTCSRGAHVSPTMVANAVAPGLLLFAGANGALTWAQSRGLPTGTAAMLIASVPLWIVLFQRVLATERAPVWGRQGLGLVAGFAGTAVLVRATPAGVEPLAALVALGSAVSWAAGSVLVSLRSRHGSARPLVGDPVTRAALQMIVGGVGCALASAALGETIPAADEVGWNALAAFGYLVVAGSIVSFLAYSFLLRTVAATRVATYAYVNPVVAVLLGMLIGESVQGATTIAMGVVLASVVLTVRTPRLPPPSPRCVPPPPRVPIAAR